MEADKFKMNAMSPYDEYEEDNFEIGKIGIKAPPVSPVLYDEKEEKSQVDVHGNVDLKTKPKVKTPPLDTAIKYEYPTHKEDIKGGGLSDYGTDMSTLQAIRKRVAQGDNIQELFKQTGSELKYKALMYKDLTTRLKKSPEEAAGIVGIPMEALDEQDAASRFVLGVKDDNLKTAAGAATIVQAMSDQIYGTENTYADDLIKQSKEATAKFNVTSDLYSHLTMTYDEDTGNAISSWDVAGTVGQSATEVAIGSLVGVGIKGITPLQTAQRQAGVELGAAITKETAQAGLHKSPVEFGIGVGSALIGEMTGLLIAKSLYKPSHSYASSKSTNEIIDALDGMAILEKNNINFGSEDLMDSENIVSKVKAQISAGKLTEPEANEILEVYNDRTMGLMIGLKKSLQAVGVTDTKQYKAFVNGKVALDDMPKMFKEFWESQSIADQARLSPKYKELENLNLDARGDKVKYNITGLMNKLEEATLISKEVGNFVNSESKYLRRFKHMDDEAITKQMVGYNATKKNIGNTLIDVNGQIDTLEQQFSQISNQNVSRAMALNKTVDPAKRMSISQDMVNAGDQIKQIQANLGQLKQRRGGLITANKNANSNIVNTKEAYRAIKTSDEMTFQDIVEFRKSLTQKMFNKGGSLSSESDVQEEALGRAIGEIDKHLEEVLSTGPGATDASKEAWVKFGLVSQEAKSYFDKWGGNKPTRRIKKLVKYGSKQQIEAAFSGEEAIENLVALKKMAGAESEIFQNWSAKVIGDRALRDVEKSSGVKSMKSIDYEQLAENIRSPQFRSLVTDVLGKETYEELNGVGYLAEVFGKQFEEVRSKTATLLRVHEIDGKGISSNPLRKYDARFRWLIEKYSGGIVKGKHFTGRTDIGPVKAKIRDVIADTIEVVAGQANLRAGLFGVHIKHAPNRTWTTKQAIKELQKELSTRAPDEKIKLMDTVMDKIEVMVKGY